MDDGHYVGALLVDVSKAFDTVPHQKLLDELYGINIGTVTTNLIRNYIIDRKHRVISRDELADWIEVTRGVPQVSYVSPPLFNIYVRNIPVYSKTDNIQFANDFSRSAADNSIEVVQNKLVKGFHKTQTFCEAPDLNLNSSKTPLIVPKPYGKKHPDNFELYFGECVIRQLK